MARFFVGITGGSGHLYTERLLQALVEAGHEVDVALTEAGCKVLRHERGVEPEADGSLSEASLVGWLGSRVAEHIRAVPSSAVEAPPSSGTSLTGGVILCPCSMGTLARISIGFSSNLVERAADVALKEGRPLVVMPRETPLSEVHLENLLRVARLGGIVLPLMPGFYHHPKSIDDVVDHVVGKLLDRLGIEHGRGARWKGLEDPPVEDGIERREG